LQLEPKQLPCSARIDYSQAMGERTLPFVVQLDLAASNLYPAPGENQRFCYNVTGVADGICHFADLKYFVLGICASIPEEQIANITVKINGMEQNVYFGRGGNVQLLTSQNPDRHTGCTGLRFDFRVNGGGGHMRFCFELARPYPIGPNPVCLFGGGIAAEGLSICGPVCEELGTCETAAYQPLNVSVPVTVTPFVNEGEATTYCCGDPIVIREPAEADCIHDGNCSFIITQKICVRIPVTFGATASLGRTFVRCGEATNEDVCTGCGTSNKPPDNKKPKPWVAAGNVEQPGASAIQACLSSDNRMLLDMILD
jgi:hypothetical protein